MVQYCPILVYQYLGLEVYFFWVKEIIWAYSLWKKKKSDKFNLFLYAFSWETDFWVILAQGVTQDLSWTGVCCLSLKTPTHL